MLFVNAILSFLKGGSIQEIFRCL